MNKKLFLLPVAMMLLASCTTPKPTPVPPEPEHDGETIETAFTAAEAIEAGKALGVKSGGSTDSKYYIKDVILGQYKTNPLFSLSYGNSTYEIGSADAKFVAYQVKKLVDGEIKNIVPTDEEAELQVGDTVCVYSKISLYASSSGTETWETTDKGSAAIASYSFGANHVTPERGAVDGTKSVSEALELLPANKDEFLWKTYNVTGKVTGEVKTNKDDSSLYQFDIADLNDSTKKGTVYNVPLASGVSVPTPGDTVVVSNIYILNFSGKLEFMLGEITSVVEGEPEPEPEPTGTELVLDKASAGLSDTALTEAKEVTLGDLVLVLEGGWMQSSKYDEIGTDTTAGTIKAKAGNSVFIEKIIIDFYKYDNYVVTAGAGDTQVTGTASERAGRGGSNSLVKEYAINSASFTLQDTYTTSNSWVYQIIFVVAEAQ